MHSAPIWMYFAMYTLQMLVALVVVTGERVEDPVEVDVRRDCEETCKRTDCSDYRGCVNRTRYGKPCQRWDTVKDWKGKVEDNAENYCRNPCHKRKSKRPCSGIWCWIDRSTRTWDYCEPWLEFELQRLFLTTAAKDTMLDQYLFVREVIGTYCRRAIELIAIAFVGGLFGACFCTTRHTECKRTLRIACCISLVLTLVSLGLVGVFLSQLAGIDAVEVPFKVNRTTTIYVYNPGPVRVHLTYLAEVGVHSCGKQITAKRKDAYRFVFIARPEGNITLEPWSTNDIREPQILGRPPSILRLIKRAFTIRKMTRCLTKSDPKIILVMAINLHVREGSVRSPFGSFGFGVSGMIHLPLSVGKYKCEFAFDRVLATLLGCGHKLSSKPPAMAPLTMINLISDGLKRYHRELRTSTIKEFNITGQLATMLRMYARALSFMWLVVVGFLGFALSVHYFIPLLRRRFGSSMFTRTISSVASYVRKPIIAEADREAQADASREVEMRRAESYEAWPPKEYKNRS